MLGLTARISEILKDPTKRVQEMLQINFFLTWCQGWSLILCLRTSRVAGVMGMRVLDLGCEFPLPVTAALARVEEPACQSQPAIVWIFLT